MPTPLPATLPHLEEAPLVLRAFGEADVPVIQEVATDPLIPLITTVPADPDPEAARSFVARQHERLRRGEGYSFAIADLGTNEALGQIGLWLRDLPQGRASIGYWLASRHRGRGIARQALGMLSTWGLSLPGVHRLELSIDPNNEASQRTAEHTGYQREGLLRSWQETDGTRHDMYLYSLLTRERT